MARAPLHAPGLRQHPRILMDKFAPSEFLAFLAAPEHSRMRPALPEHGKADTTVIRWQTTDDQGGDRGETNCARKRA